MSWTPRIVTVAREDTLGAKLLAHIAGLARSESVAVVVAPAAAATPQAVTLAAVVGDHLVAVVVAPDDEERLVARARDLTGTEHGGGVAVAPFDGIDATVLFESARAACDRAGPGIILRAEDAVDELAFGNRIALVADAATAQSYELARRLAPSGIPVMICGPTGSGKDLIATAIHASSPRANRPFVALNCAAIPDGLAEAELFGHAKGAFTGALAPRPGVIEASSGGTLFLDEVAELSPATQARLLRVLESGEVQRVGETVPRPIDLRVIAATHRDLAHEVEAGRFRKDLWYRLGVARVTVAPLRERPRDLAALVRRFTSDACARLRRSAMTLAPATARALFAHSWPGNIRELRHSIEYAVAAAGAREMQIHRRHLPELRDDNARPKMRALRPRSIAAELQALERLRMVEALATCAGLQNKAAALIQMPLRSFVAKMKRYGITERDWTDLDA